MENDEPLAIEPVVTIHEEDDTLDVLDIEQSETDAMDLIKVRSNIAEVFFNSNATPLKGHNTTGYDCYFCEEKFATPADLKKHVLDEHDGVKNLITKQKSLGTLLPKLDITGLRCSICFQEIDTLEDFMSHLKNIHDKTIYTDIRNQMLPFKFDSEKLKCCICNKGHSNFRTLCIHMSVHYRNYVCKICNAGFVNKHGLISHMVIHKTDSQYGCSYCPKIFDTQRRALRHERGVHTHSHVLNRCPHCNEYFKNYAKKVKHLAVVHGVGNINPKCSECPKSFSAITSLVTHMKTAHPTVPKHPCKDCDQIFFSATELRQHSVEHTGQQKFQCKVCFKSYRKKFNLQEHMRSHDNNKNFKCEFCGRCFIHKCSLKRHKCLLQPKEEEAEEKLQQEETQKESKGKERQEHSEEQTQETAASSTEFAD